jgi:hypothetical protein
MKKLVSVFIPLFFICIVNAQNVGIGTSTPNAKLDVFGTLKVTDGTQGAGKVWQAGNHHHHLQEQMIRV